MFSDNQTNQTIDIFSCDMLEKFKGNKDQFKKFEGNMRVVLTLFLGFFVATTIKRWWNQTSKIPRLTDLAVICNAVFLPGKFFFHI